MHKEGRHKIFYMIKDKESAFPVIHSFLMMGQSNMAGRGKVGEVPPIINQKIHMLRNGRWVRMNEPINPDRQVYPVLERFPVSGIGPAASFAEEYVNHFSDEVGLIPCADGGTSMNDWAVGGLLYDNAIAQAKLAQRTSILSGILWHQGEGDCATMEKVRAYHDKFITFITAIRKGLNAGDVPLVIGEIGMIHPNDPSNCFHELNQEFHSFQEEIPNCAVASADGLTLYEDGLHFDSASQRKFGRRYFAEYKNLI